MHAETVLPTVATVSTDPKVWSQITHLHLMDMWNEQLLETAQEFLERVKQARPMTGCFHYSAFSQGRCEHVPWQRSGCECQQKLDL